MLLEFAKIVKFLRGFLIKGVASFGHSKKIHEEHFYELGSIAPCVVQFILSSDEATRFLNLIKSHKLNIFYTSSEIEYGHI
jgi:PII-like signaling protein